MQIGCPDGKIKQNKQQQRSINISLATPSTTMTQNTYTTCTQSNYTEPKQTRSKFDEHVHKRGLTLHLATPMSTHQFAVAKEGKALHPARDGGGMSVGHQQQEFSFVDVTYKCLLLAGVRSMTVHVRLFPCTSANKCYWETWVWYLLYCHKSVPCNPTHSSLALVADSIVSNTSQACPRKW